MTIAVQPRLKRSQQETFLLWTVFLFYLLLLSYAGLHHELWGDEVHSWNLAKGSGSYLDLLSNRRYEGHPPAWYTLLWALSKFTHQVVFIQITQELIAVLIAYIILFKTPLALSTRILIPFGYYFLFEYGVLSRNYALGSLFACCICLILRKDFRYRSLLYYVLLFCMSNVHLLSLFLAGSIHLYFLGLIREQKRPPRKIGLHALLGIAALLPAIYFIHLPSDSEVNICSWISSWSFRELENFYQPVLRAFLPVPAWRNYNFWNTEFLLEAVPSYGFLKWVNPLIAIALLACTFSMIRKSKKCTTLFGVNLLLSYALSATAFSLITARHAGFLYIGFIIAWWLYNEEKPVTASKIRLINALLIIQLAAGIFAVSKDIRLPFSNMYQVNALIREIPAGKKLVTDYWTMNAIVAFTDRPVYCVDVQKELSFVLFDSHLRAVDDNPHRYTDGLHQLFQKNGMNTAYMISLSSPQLLAKVDTLLARTYHLTLVDKREGAIEKGSNLYLYQVQTF